MTRLIVKVPDENDLQVLREILDRFGLAYTVDKDWTLSENEIAGLVRTKNNFY